MVTGQAIVNSAYKLLGAPYRTWFYGNSLPMWLDDAVPDPPPVKHLLYYGVMCSDLVNFVLEDNGLPPGYGTANFADYLIDQQDFDPSSPGETGAIALAPYQSPEPGFQGHIGIYVDEKKLIQAIHNPGVTDWYTDEETYNWGGDTEFTIYGFLPGVSYEGSGEVAPGTKVPEGGYVAIGADGNLVIDGEDCSRGWYTLPSWDYKGWRWTKEGGYF